MLDKVKLALCVSGTAKDSEISDLIDAALKDLGIAGVYAEENDALIIRAVITYCKANFIYTSDSEKLQEMYEKQKAQLQTATGYTNWGAIDGQNV